MSMDDERIVLKPFKAYETKKPLLANEMLMETIYMAPGSVKRTSRNYAFYAIQTIRQMVQDGGQTTIKLIRKLLIASMKLKLLQFAR